jgi:hypothetical protein
MLLLSYLFLCQGAFVSLHFQTLLGDQGDIFSTSPLLDIEPLHLIQNFAIVQFKSTSVIPSLSTMLFSLDYPTLICCTAKNLDGGI